MTTKQDTQDGQQQIKDAKDTQPQEQQMKDTEERTTTQQEEKEEDTSAEEKENKENVAVQETNPSSAAIKRKFDALATKPSIPEQENKKARTSTLTKSPPTRVLEKKPATARKGAKMRDFSFARPTASSASRIAAVASAHAQVKATTAPFLAGKLHAMSDKYDPAPAQRASVPASKTARSPFGYTPYTGPLPPLTVESSFAPKN